MLAEAADRAGSESVALMERVAAAAPPQKALQAMRQAYLSKAHVQGVESGCATAALSLDVTSDESVHAAVSEVIRLQGRIDVVVNNAGFGVAPAGAEESSLEQARAIFDTNFFGIVRMTRAVVPHMRQQASGRIINIGSVRLDALAV